SRQVLRQIMRTVAGKSGRRAPVRLAVLALVAFLPIAGGLARGFAQTASTRAGAGTVTDPSQPGVAGAQSPAGQKTTGEKRTVDSGAAGAYVIPFLSPGTYKVEASQKGFKQAVYSDLRVDITETVKLDIRLEIGAAQEMVTVESRGLQLQTESTNL